MSLSKKLQRKQVTLRMVPSLVKQVKLLAAAQEISFSEFIEDAVDFYITEKNLNLEHILDEN